MIIDIVKYCAVNPFLSITKIAEHFAIAYTTAHRIIKKLELHDIVTQVTSDKRNRVYCATKILAILEEPANLNIPEEQE